MLRKIGHVNVSMAPDNDGSGGGGSGEGGGDDGNRTVTLNAEGEELDDDGNVVKPTDPNKFELTPKFWETTNEETGDDPDKIKAAETARSKEFTDHVASLDFGEFEISAEDIASFVSSGDTKGLGEAIRKQGQQVYAKSMQDVATLIKQSKDAMMVEVRAELTLHSGAKDDLTALHSALEVTKNPAVQPVAIAVMKQAMSKDGVTQAQGIEAVREFFKAVRQDDAETDQAPPGSAGFRGNKADEIDFAAALAGVESA